MLHLLTWNVFEMQLLIPLWWQTYYSYQLIKVNFLFSKTITVEYVFYPLLCVSRVYSRSRPCGISAIWKKMPHIIHVAATNGSQKKIDSRISTFLKNKVFENITDNNTDLTAVLQTYFDFS